MNSSSSILSFNDDNSIVQRDDEEVLGKELNFTVEMSSNHESESINTISSYLIIYSSFMLTLLLIQRTSCWKSSERIIQEESQNSGLQDPTQN